MNQSQPSQPDQNPNKNIYPNPQESVPQTQSPQQNSNKSYGVGYSIVAIVLLLVAFPFGLIFMWLATSWSKGFKWFLTLFFPVLFLISMGLLLYSSSRHKSSQPQSPSKFLSTQFDKVSSFDKYTSTSFGIDFEYPYGWQVYDRGNAAIPIQIMNCDAQSRDYCEHIQGGSGQLVISISKVGIKSSDINLVTYLKSKNKISNEGSSTKTSNGYERVDSSSRSSFISNGTIVLSITQMSSSFGIDPKIADKIIDSIKFK